MGLFYFKPLEKKRMPESQQGASSENSQGNQNGGSGEGSQNAPEKTTFTSAEMQSEVDRRVNQALKTERDKFKDLMNQKELDAQSKLNQLEQLARDAENKASFLTEITKSGGCIDIEAAYVLATAKGFVKDGKTDLDALKKAHPLLFAEPRKTTINAGTGTTSQPNGSTFDQAIRSISGH